MVKYIETHIFYIVLIIVSIIAVHIWIQEHDARKQAEQSVKIAETQVKDLQAQIQAVNAASQKQVQVVVKTVAAAKTPAQVVSTVPQLTDAPLNARVSIDNPNQVSVDSQPFIQLLGQCKEDSLSLGACQKTEALQTEQLAEKDKEVASLKAKPKFWARVKARIKTFGIDFLIIEGLKIAITKRP